MKKLITTATLLAAGTALASAWTTANSTSIWEQSTDSVKVSYNQVHTGTLVPDSGGSNYYESNGQSVEVQAHAHSNVKVDFNEDARYQIQFKVRFDGTNNTLGGIPVCNLTMVNSNDSSSLLFGNADDCYGQLGIVHANVPVTSATEVLTTPTFGVNVYSVTGTGISGYNIPEGIYTYTIIFETFADSNVADKVYFGVNGKGKLNIRSSDLKMGTGTDLVFDDIGFSIRGADYDANSVNDTIDGKGGATLLAGNNATFTKWTRTTEQISDPSVPEPSAFGLLAGVGAIALAASRRRRSRA